MPGDPIATAAAQGREGHREALRRATGRAALVLPALVLAFGGLARRWVGDDGFINVRVAQQLLAGNGLVFNTGERVEAITSPGWVLLLSSAGALGMRVDDAAWSLSLILAVAGVLASGLAAPQLWARTAWQRGWVLPLGLLCYACLPPAWDYATSGLENGLGLAFLGGSYWAVAACLAAPRPSQRALDAAALLLGAGPLVRPDYALLSQPLVALLCWRASGARARFRTAGASLAVGALYQVFRMGYFACLVPNTALAKEAFRARWDQGLLYFWNSAGVYWLLVPLACAVLGVVCRRGGTSPAGQAFAVSLLLTGVLHLLYVMRVGGDFMHGRMLLPGLFAIFSAAPLAPIEASLSPRTRWVAAGLCLVASVGCLICALRLRVGAQNDHDIGDERGWFARLAEHEHPTRIEHYARMPFHRKASEFAELLASRCEGATSPVFLRHGECKPALLTRGRDGKLRDHPESALLRLDPGAVPPEVDAVVAFPPLGIAGAVLGTRVSVVDSFGLADPVGARLELLERGRPGHEKAFGTVWLSAKYASGRTRDNRVKAARQALDCGLVLELRHATSDPLDLRRFLRNVAQSFALHGLRVPTEPYTARSTFCDTPR